MERWEQKLGQTNLYLAVDPTTAQRYAIDYRLAKDEIPIIVKFSIPELTDAGMKFQMLDSSMGILIAEGDVEAIKSLGVIRQVPKYY